MSEATPSAIPTIGSPAPDFTANTTQGEISLHDERFAGKWIVLFSHPYDFTPVCSTEFVGFAERTPQFEEINTQLIGLSIDSVFSHIAWMRSLENDHGVTVTFPVIADLDKQVASAYGMVHPGASDMAPVRAVFVIDPKRTIRALVYYPMNVGRDLDEVLRLVKGLQYVDANEGTACPANWQPGDQIILPPPATKEAAAARLAENEGNADAKDWYFVKRDG
jgi:peroxiredoxin (alkyl hydroperoxide reductase subunit C)